MSEVAITGAVPAVGREAVDACLDVGERVMRRATLIMEAQWKRRAERSRRTGHYLRNIAGTVERRSVGRLGGHVIGSIGNPVFYARYLEEGTGLYGPRNRWITPKSKKVLRFPEPGNPGFTLAGRRRSGRAGAGARYLFRPRVRGIRPRHFMRDAAMVVEPQVMKELRGAGLMMAAEIERR